MGGGNGRKVKKILAVASGGGHWMQLLRLRPAFGDFDVVYVTTNRAYENEAPGPLFVVADANRREKPKLALMFVQVALLVIRIRPDFVVSTGAAPGFAAMLFGRIAGARTVWIDSIANSGELSDSGRRARNLADVWLTQWPHLARDGGPEYWGSVL